MSEPAWTSLDSLRAWELVLQLARDGHSGLRDWFGGEARPVSEPERRIEEARS